MSIIVLTPKPPQAKAAGTNTVAQTEGSLAARVGEDFLHLLGHEGYRFDSFEQLRDFAQAQIDATALANTIEQAAPAEPVAAAPAVAVEPAAPIPVPAAEGSHDAAAAATGSAEVAPDSIIVLTPPPPQ
jgi:hypothetical protein